MSDLIERLRGFEGSDDLGNGDFSLCAQAADQLEAPQAEIAELKTALSATAEAAATHLKNKIAADAEIARLREVLRSIAERPGEGVEYSPGHGDEVCSEARHMELIARKALEQKP